MGLKQKPSLRVDMQRDQIKVAELHEEIEKLKEELDNII